MADARHSLLVSGSGDVIQPTDGILSGRLRRRLRPGRRPGLAAHTDLSAGEIVRESLEIAGGIDIYTNGNLTVEELPCQHDPIDSPADRRRAGPRYRRPGRRQAGRGHRPPQPLAAPATARRAARPGHAQEHPLDRPDRRGQNRDRPPPGPARAAPVRQGRSHQVHRGRLLRPRRREPDSRPVEAALVPGPSPRA